MTDQKDKTEDKNDPKTDKEESKIEELEQKIEKLEEEKEEYHNKYLRTLAEFENFKKRQKKLFNTMTDSFRDELIGRFLEVLDNFERALAVCPVDDEEGYIQGFRLIADQMRDFLHSEEIEPIDSTDVKFDPNKHEAVQSIPSEEKDPGQVLEVLQKGYKRDDRLIRPAKVIVSCEPKKEKKS